jgi:hypothetical protein
MPPATPDEPIPGRRLPLKPKWYEREYVVHEAAERLIKSRKAAGYESAAAAAEAMHIKVVTYQHHENGRRAITPQVAETYAKFFGVTALHILRGDELPDARGMRIIGVIGAKGFVRMLRTEEQTTIVPPPPGDPDTMLTPMTVDGNDLYPVYQDKDTVWFDPYELNGRVVPSRVYGKDCIVRLADRSIVLRRVLHIQHENRKLVATLGHYGTDDVLHEPILGAARIRWTMKPE